MQGEMAGLVGGSWMAELSWDFVVWERALLQHAAPCHDKPGDKDVVQVPSLRRDAAGLSHRVNVFFS